VADSPAVAAVALPTATGVLVAIAAEEVAMGGAMRYLAALLALFWSWRLYRQTRIGAMLPAAWHRVLCGIFVVQGAGVRGGAVGREVDG
jgi:hypothetical protein